MKRSLLLSLIGFISWGASAQDNTSIIFKTPAEQHQGVRLSAGEMERMMSTFPKSPGTHTAAKTTSCLHLNWYDMWGQNYNPGISKAYYYAVMPDSNMIDNTAASPYHIWMHGMGLSFDATDSAYYSTTFNAGACHDPIPPADIVPYRFWYYDVDSFNAAIAYVRNDPVTTRVDTLVIEFVLTQAYPVLGPSTDSGAYSLQMSTGSVNWPVCADHKPRWGTVHYNSGLTPPFNMQPYINDCYFDSVFTMKERFSFILDAAAASDTTAGLLNLAHLQGVKLAGTYSYSITPDPSGASAFPIIPMTVSLDYPYQKRHLITYISFKPQASYAPGALATQANWIKVFAGEPLGDSTWWKQGSSDTATGYPGSYSQSLVATNRIRYSDTGFSIFSPGHNTLVPAFSYYDASTHPYPPGFEVPWMQFYLEWIDCPMKVEPRAAIANLSVAPNPANTTLTITCTTDPNTTVSAALTNMIGQVVATQQMADGKVTFNTSELPTGIYIYSIEANGQRVTGKAVITH